MKADRTLVPQTVLEIIRYGMGGPAGLPRYAVRDFEMRGKQIRKGQMLMLSFGGANRDPEVFANPDEFDITRDNSNLLMFGFGAHYCLGVHLAKAELRASVDAMCDFLPTGGRDPQRSHGVPAHGHVRAARPISPSTSRPTCRSARPARRSGPGRPQRLNGSTGRPQRSRRKRYHQFGSRPCAWKWFGICRMTRSTDHPSGPKRASATLVS